MPRARGGRTVGGIAEDGTRAGTDRSAPGNTREPTRIQPQHRNGRSPQPDDRREHEHERSDPLIPALCEGVAGLRVMLRRSLAEESVIDELVERFTHPSVDWPLSRKSVSTVVNISWVSLAPFGRNKCSRRSATCRVRLRRPADSGRPSPTTSAPTCPAPPETVATAEHAADTCPAAVIAFPLPPIAGNAAPETLSEQPSAAGLRRESLRFRFQPPVEAQPRKRSRPPNTPPTPFCSSRLRNPPLGGTRPSDGLFR